MFWVIVSIERENISWPRKPKFRLSYINCQNSRERNGPALFFPSTFKPQNRLIILMENKSFFYFFLIWHTHTSSYMNFFHLLRLRIFLFLKELVLPSDGDVWHYLATNNFLFQIAKSLKHIRSEFVFIQRHIIYTFV